ncbi:uncharacterized protein PFL1_02792 [Pseudozyma flocculosa PF-1]|nr:uncharacterized protein PFL1_02792 [Pseudozyma flocculosa PF-1]EPQ29573.1 hypothetical protein PFL1_02792 [Pseudozyma flocculosa PF-1]
MRQHERSAPGPGSPGLGRPGQAHPRQAGHAVDEDPRRYDLSAEEDELSDDESSSIPQPKRRGEGSARKASAATPKERAGPSATGKGKAISAEQSPHLSPQEGGTPSFRFHPSSSPVRGLSAARADRLSGPSRGSMQIHISDDRSQSTAPLDTDRHSPLAPSSSHAQASPTSAPVSARPGFNRESPRGPPSGTRGTMASEEAQRPSAAHEPGAAHERGARAADMPSPPPSCAPHHQMGPPLPRHSEMASRDRADNGLPNRPTCAGDRLAPLQARDDLTPEEVDIFLDLIIKHQPATLSPENMTRSVNALYDDWLAMCATNSIVAKPKKALMDEYDKIYKGRYGPAAASRARWIAEESARTSTRPSRPSVDSVEGRQRSESPATASNMVDRGSRQPRSPQRSDAGSNIGQPSSSADAVAGSGSRESDTEARKRKNGEDGPQEGPDRSQRRKLNGQAGGPGETSSSATSGIAKVGRNGLAVLPPGLFDILRNTLKDDILGNIVPVIRSDLAEQSRDIVMQNQEIMTRLRGLEELTRAQDVCIRRLLARDQAEWAVQAEAPSPWQAKKGLRGMDGEMVADGGYRSYEPGPPGPSPSQRIPSGSTVWPSSGSPTLASRRRSDYHMDDPRLAGGMPPHYRPHGSYDSRPGRLDDPIAANGRISPSSRSAVHPFAGDRIEGEDRDSMRAVPGPGSYRDYPPPPHAHAHRERHRHSLSVDDWRSPAGLAIVGAEQAGHPGAQKYSYGSPHAVEGPAGAPPYRNGPASSFPRGQRGMRPSPPPLSAPPPPQPASSTAAAMAGGGAVYDGRATRPLEHHPFGRNELHREAASFGIDSRPMAARPPSGFGAGSPRHR